MKYLLTFLLALLPMQAVCLHTGSGSCEIEPDGRECRCDLHDDSKAAALHSEDCNCAKTDCVDLNSRMSYLGSDTHTWTISCVVIFPSPAPVWYFAEAEHATHRAMVDPHFPPPTSPLLI